MRISELVIACFNMDGMLAFYKNVFDISFETIEIPQGNVYVGFVGDMQLTLCSASIAGIQAQDNRHQLTVLIDEMNETIKKTKQFGGTVTQGVEQINRFLHASIKDVDDNSIVLKQIMK